jgi:hypothetical protein
MFFSNGGEWRTATKVTIYSSGASGIPAEIRVGYPQNANQNFATIPTTMMKKTTDCSAALSFPTFCQFLIHYLYMKKHKISRYAMKMPREA